MFSFLDDLKGNGSCDLMGQEFRRFIEKYQSKHFNSNKYNKYGFSKIFHYFTFIYFNTNILIIL